MVIDSSALIALLLGEPETTGFVTAIATASSRVVSAPTYLETAIVILARLGPIAREKLDQLAVLAINAYRQYGKGSGHGELNFGDCFSYALSKLRDEPLLFKGNDFARTDLVIAVAS